MNAGNHTQKKKQKGPMLLLEDEENLPYTDPNDHYHIGKSTKYKLNIYQWPDEELEQDIVYKVRLRLLHSISDNCRIRIGIKNCWIISWPVSMDMTYSTAMNMFSATKSEAPSSWTMKLYTNTRFYGSIILPTTFDVIKIL